MSSETLEQFLKTRRRRRRPGQAEHLARVQERACHLPDQIVVKAKQSHECDPCSSPNYMGKECGVTAMAWIAVGSSESAADPARGKRK